MNTRLVPAALLGALALLAGCTEEPAAAPPAPSASPSASPTPTVPRSADLLARIERAAAEGPRSATIAGTTDIDGKPEVSVTGRVNLTERATGTLRVTGTGTQGQQLSGDLVVTEGGTWARRSGDTRWRKARTGGEVLGIADHAAYPSNATALLSTGEDVVRGREQIAGAGTVRLSGRLTQDLAARFSPAAATRMEERGIDGFDVDVWVDDRGRVVQVEQWIRTQLNTEHTLVTLTGHGPPVEVKRPA